MSVLPVYLVTGFLGGGKTTLLRELARCHPQKRMMFLVNELSGSDVDAGRLSGQGQETHAVVGGSIFCECKAADFLSMLKHDVMPAHLKSPLDALIIETSGIADPSAIGTLIEKAGYGDALKVRQIVTILSPKSFKKLQGNLPVFDAQIQAADLIVLNKCDLATSEELAFCKQSLQQLNAAARLTESSFCKDLPFFENERSGKLPQAAFTKCSDLKFINEFLEPGVFQDQEALKQDLTCLATGAYRVKGCLKAADKWFQVDATPDGISLEETTEQKTGVVVIREKGKPALIACDVFKEELELIPGLPEYIVWLPMGLHDRPHELKARLQNEIDQIEADPKLNKILLLYGICGGVDGLITSRCPMILPRTHDCIALLLGSQEEHQKIQMECPGTYFYAPGWIREGRVPGPHREGWLRKQYEGKYDEEMIDELVEVDEECFQHYEKALFIKTPAAGDSEEGCKKCAQYMNWEFEVTKGDPTWLYDFFKGAEDEARFKVIQPGQILTPSGTTDLFK